MCVKMLKGMVPELGPDPRHPLLTGARFLQSSWLVPRARELFRRCRPCTSARKPRKTPCVHRYQSKKPLPKCSQCVPRNKFFRMLLLAMWPEAKLLRCPGGKGTFLRRGRQCVCACEDVGGHGPWIKSGPDGRFTYRCKVPLEFLVVPGSPRTF